MKIAGEMKRMTTLILLVGMLVLGTGVAKATDISGTITATLTIMEDSQLVGDVTCNIANPPGGPCILVGASGIMLNLNGFTMTGQGFRDSCAAVVDAEDGISIDGQTGVLIQGPGLVRRFRRDGIRLGGNNNQVSNVVVASSCQNGIQVLGSGNQVVANTVVRASLRGIFFAGISVGGTGGHAIQQNQVVGASDLAAQSGARGGHGIVVAGSSTGNLIENNNASGNPGVGIFLLTDGNTIRRNQTLGNLIFHDIFDNNAAGANTYDGNVCEVSGGTGAPACPNLPSLAGY